MSTPNASPPKEDLKVKTPPSEATTSTTTVLKPSTTVAGPSTEGPKLTAAEKKAQKVAEKAARRAKALQQKTDTASTASTNSTPTKGGSSPGDTGKKGGKQQGAGSGSKAQSSADVKDGAKKEIPAKPEKKKNQVLLFNHLPQRGDGGSVSPEKKYHVHFEVRALGLQLIEYIVCGSNERFVSMLAVLKTVIQEYETPENQALTRHMVPYVINPQLRYLVSCRPLSIAQGNAIRWLKLQISEIDVSTPEDEAKEHLCALIDEFVRDKSTLAHHVIATKAARLIGDGDVILTFAKSVVVEKTIRKAWADGKRFKLIIIDNYEPLNEGQRLATSLMADKTMKDMEINLGSYHSISKYMYQTTRVLLGAHAVMSNGSLYNRIGTAGIALEAKSSGVPVTVLCESIKFSAKAPSNSIDMNELAPVEEMLARTRIDNEDIWTSPAEYENGHPILKSLANVKGINAYNLMYDHTQSALIDSVISEQGAVPSTSAPILNRLYNEVGEV